MGILSLTDISPICSNLSRRRASCADGPINGRSRMPNIASVLKDEVLRLARKEVRTEIEGLKKASVQYRSDIAALKRRVADVEKQHARLEKKGPKKVMVEAEGEASNRFRFSAQR